MGAENIGTLLGKRVSKVIETSLNQLLPTDAPLTLARRMKEEYKVDLTKYEDLLLKPESFEMALIAILGHGANLLLRGISQNLIKEFSINPPESFQYRKEGDYVKLVYKIKATQQIK